MIESFQQHKDTKQARYFTHISTYDVKNYIIFKEID